VKRLIGEIKARAPYQSRNLFGHCRTLFMWAVHHDIITVSPVASLKAKWVLGGTQIGPRQRVLSDAEIAAFWRATGRLGYPAGLIYRLLMLTACRLNEVVEAQWSEFNPHLRRLIREARKADQKINWTQVPDNLKTWTIPRERFKSDSEHVVPLSGEACRTLETLPQQAGSDLFTLSGTSPIWFNSKYKKHLDGRMLRTLKAQARLRGEDPTQVKLAPWVNHDLRRVVRSNLSALGIEDHIAEMVLGHGRKGLQRVYDQHRYEAQIRDALERWAARLREIVTPALSPPPSATADNVVALRSRAAQ
jgi:integrase